MKRRTGKKIERENERGRIYSGRTMVRFLKWRWRKNRGELCNQILTSRFSLQWISDPVEVERVEARLKALEDSLAQALELRMGY